MRTHGHQHRVKTQCGGCLARGEAVPWGVWGTLRGVIGCPLCPWVLGVYWCPGVHGFQCGPTAAKGETTVPRSSPAAALRLAEAERRSARAPFEYSLR